MSDAQERKYVVEFFGWCNDPAQHHDKIWGWAKIAANGETICYNFWGPRTKKLTFKRYADAEISKLLGKQEEKLNSRESRYKAVPTRDIEKVYPNFYTEFDHQLVLARLMNRVQPAYLTRE